MSYEPTTQDFAAVRTAAKILTARYRGFVSYEDVEQELWVWLIANHHKAEKWREDYEERHAERTLVKALRNVGDRYCREEKAQREGYEPEDEFFYSLPMVADLLALSFDPEWFQPGGVEYTSTSSQKPAGEGGNLVALVSDVGRAFDSLPPADRRLLRYVYGDKDSTARITSLSLDWNCTYSAAYNRVRRVVGRVRAALGGPSPYVKEKVDAVE